MRTTNRCDRMLLAVLVCVAVAGCAAFRNTLAQDQALERWQMCQGKAPDVTLKEVRPDGQSWFFYSSPSGLAKAHECLKEAAEIQRKRTLTPGTNIAVVTPPSSTGSGAAAVVSSTPDPQRGPMPPTWKIASQPNAATR